MKKLLIPTLMVLGLVGFSCSAPTSPVETTSTTTPPSTTESTTTITTPSTTTTEQTTTTLPVTKPGLPVDERYIPASNPGFNTVKIGPAGYSKTPGDAAFRINCQLSHMRWDDPIVRPGAANGSHLHSFFGNTGTSYASTPESIRTTGNSTCTGGIANRSSYWVPTLVDTATNRPVDSNVTQIDKDNALQVYYKAGYQGVDSNTIVNYPVGLRMIAGDMMSTRAQSKVQYNCGVGEPTSGSFPNCPPGSLFIMAVAFPQCWDGVNLDSPDHKSHMAYGAGWPDKGCPSSHPVPLAEITQNYRYRVPASGMSTWRLSSDIYTGPAGYSGHADWMNGWDAATFQRVVDNCYKGSFDCSMNLLGDGWMLT